MIFNDNPLANEPMVNGADISHDARCYNEVVRYLVVRFALLGWIESDIPALWKDVVESHFKKRGDEIVQTIKRWAEIPLNSRYMNMWIIHIYHLSPNPTIASLIQRLQKGLKRFGVDTSSLSSFPINSHQSAGHEHGYRPRGGHGPNYGMGGYLGRGYGGGYGGGSGEGSGW